MMPDTRADSARLTPSTTRVAFALAAIPWLISGALTWRYAKDTPYWDEWDHLAPVVVKAMDGTLQTADLWVRVNEHLFVTSGIIVVPIARISQWNMRIVTGLTFVLFTIAFVLFIRLALGAIPAYERRTSFWIVPVCATLFFSYAQHAVFTWSLHVAIGLALVFILLSVSLLTHGELTWPRLVFAIIIAAMASISFGAGLAAWPAGCVALAFRTPRHSISRRASLAAWLAGAAAMSVVYVVGGEAEPAVPAPIPFVAYTFAFLGGPLSLGHGPTALVAGAVFVIVVGFVVCCGKRSPAFDPAMMALASVGVVVGLLSGLKHSHEGIQQAVSSRLLTWPTLSWCALLVLASVAAVHIPRMRHLQSTFVLLVMLLALAGFGVGAYRADERYDAFVLGRHALIHDPQSDALSYLHPNPEMVRARRDDLVRHRLTCFRNAPPDLP